MSVPISHCFTDLSVFFFCNSPPIRPKASGSPSPAGLADSTILTAPVIVIILLGLILLTAGIIYTLNTQYKQPESGLNSAVSAADASQPDDIS